VPEEPHSQKERPDLKLEGTVEGLELGEVFRLLKLEGGSGVLEVFRGAARTHFRIAGGLLYFADSPAVFPGLDERFVRAGVPGYVVRDLRARAASNDPLVWVDMLLREEQLTREDMADIIRRHVEAVAFLALSWDRASYTLTPLPGDPDERRLVGLDLDGVAIEGVRRVDEWRLMMQAIGSLERVPHPVPGSTREVVLSASEWEFVCFADGRRDLHTMVKDTRMERFELVKLAHGLVKAGLIVVRDPTLELLGQTTAVALKGPIDIYNLTFLTTAVAGEVSSHLRLETVEEEEIEIHLSAGVRDLGDDESCLLYFADARTPSWVIKRMAMETSGFVLLVNVNSRDSIAVSRGDVALLEEIGDRPYVVATYASLEEEKIEDEEVRAILRVNDEVPLLRCGLRDHEEVAAVLEALLALIP
jgi:hypothetical protein